MKQTTRHRAARHRTLPAQALLVLALMLLASCSMMTEDRSDCPDCRNPLHVVLRYDYNMERADMFHDQVQSVTCYLADAETNRIVDVQMVWNTYDDKPLKASSFAFNFEGLDEGDYRVLALASAPAQPGHEQYVTRNLTIGDDITELNIRFPRAAKMNREGRYNAPAQPLDTLWHAISSKPIHLTKQAPAYDTLSLVRDTKNLSIVLMQTQNPTECRAEDYEVRITDSNGLLDYRNQPLPDDPLTYRPYAAWTTETLSGDADGGTRATDVIARTAHYDLSFARLIAHDTSKDNARLQIVNSNDGKTILDIDLVYYLALARNASARSYNVQEFLDREHDYHLDVVLSGNEWRYMTISISVLSWSLRIYNEKL